MEHKLSALIVDDEESARRLMVKLLEETLYFSEIRLANSVDSALIELNKFNPDLIFLDIKMPGKYGIEFVDELHFVDGKPGIVFVTAYDQYAIQAIKIQAFDYLLKPVNRKELKNCIEKYASRQEEVPSMLVSRAESLKKFSRIKVNTRTGTVFINPATILFCKAEGNYTTICTGEKEYLCSLNLGKLKEQLPVSGFIRIGRSLIINFEYITLLDRKKSAVTLVRENESVTVKIPHQHLKDLDIL
ncbi:MAG: response regulator transcription factor [Bacteroidales bacterium]|nr:response regulator transcription factor [Bacteroidales bacterium]